jgi:hypothetical protein
MLTSAIIRRVQKTAIPVITEMPSVVLLKKWFLLSRCGQTIYYLLSTQRLCSASIAQIHSTNSDIEKRATGPLNARFQAKAEPTI